MNMLDIHKPAEVGTARIAYTEVSREEAARSQLRGGLMSCSPGQYVVLYVNGKVTMSNTAMERKTNWAVMFGSYGDVLISGLGIGMIVVPLLGNPKVTSVTVLEANQDVIALVEPRLRQATRSCGAHKLSVLHADAFTWKPPKGQRWDCIYHDIWSTICEDNLKEITTLKRKYASRLHPGGTQSAWVEKLLRDRKKRNQNRRYRWA